MKNLGRFHPISIQISSSSLVIVQSDTAVDIWTVMVESKSAESTGRTVMTSIWLHLLALVTVSRERKVGDSD